MTTLLRKPAIFAAAIAATLVLAFGVLCAAPATAVADDGSLTAADGAAPSEQQDLSTQAGTESIPVITKMAVTTTRMVNGKLKPETTNSKVKYNSNGQISAWGSTTYYYNKKGGMTSSKYSYSSGYSGTYDYALDKMGRVKEIDGRDLNYAIRPKYDEKGYVAKEVAGPYKDTFTWDENGLLQKAEYKGGSQKYGWSYTYDSKGNLATASPTSSGLRQVFTFANTYDGDLLKKRVETDDQGEMRFTVKYTYKTIEVPTSFAAQVKAQQKWLKYRYMTSDKYPRLESMYL